MPDARIEAGRLTIVRPTGIADGSGGQFSLANAARSWTMLWLTLRAMGWSVARATSPSSRPVQVSWRHGSDSSLAGLISNPRFYEMMMGWPLGWTDPERPVPATASAAWLRRSRGLFSRLITDFLSEGANDE